MAINNVKNTQSLLADIEDWMNNPKFQPQEQNKWFFGEGLSYYTQLCEVVKVLTYLQENFKVVIANEKSLEQAYNEVKDLPNQFNTLSTKVDDLTNTVSDLPTRVQELETKVTKLISDVSNQLTRIETLEGSVSTNTGSITTLNSEVDKIKVKDGEQDVKIEKLQSNVVSINAKDISQDSEIASIKSKNQEQDTLIDSNTNKITTLEGKDFLTNVRLENSNSITFQGGEKVDGVQTYTAQAIGSVPVNLGENVAYASNNNTSILTNINSNVIINSPVTNNYHELVKTLNIIDNGELIEKNITIAYFNKNYFSNNNNIFSLNINNIISRALLLDGSNILYNPVSNLNNFSTGVGLFHDGENLPFTTTSLIISGSHQKNNALIQLALSYAGEIKYRTYNIDKKVWKEWKSLFIDNLSSSNNYCALSANQGRILNETKQDKLTFSPTWFVVDGINVSLKESIFNSYLTKTEASGEYETIVNASTIYETKQNASATYETKANASTTYETKANATATYETKANASTTYETKAHATETYPTKTEMTNAINSAIGTAINSTY